MNNKLHFIKKAKLAKKYTEEEKARFRYLIDKPEYYLGGVITADSVELSDIFDSKNKDENGDPVSRFAKLTFYIDKEKVKVDFSFNFWDTPKDGIIRIKHDHVLSNLIKAIAEDDVNNTFDIDYKGLQDIVNEIDYIKIIPKILRTSKSGFKTYGFDVLNIEWKSSTH